MARMSALSCHSSPVCVKILHQHLDRQAALHLELTEDAGPGFFQHGQRQIGRDDLGPPARQRRARFLQAHRDRIGLLPGR